MNEEISENEYKCAACGEIYKKGWSDEEMLEEAENINFKGLHPSTPGVIVCDDCYIKMGFKEEHHATDK